MTRMTEVERLREENDFLRERLRVLEEEVGAIGEQLPPNWGLTPSEQQVLNVLLKTAGRRITADVILSMIRVHCLESNPVPVYVYRIKSKFQNLGIPFELQSRRGVGYFLSPEAAERIKEAARREWLKPAVYKVATAHRQQGPFNSRH